MSTGRMNWDQAILEVLRESAESLTVKDIVHEIRERELRQMGASSEGSVAAQLSILFKGGSVARPERGRYQIATASSAPASAEAIAEVEEEAKVSSVANYGLFWERDRINWNPGQGRTRQYRLPGSADDSAEVIEFGDQQGVYILYDRTSPVYVGRTIRNNLFGRLSDHNAGDRRGARWDRFSWFGFRAVNEDGTLSSESANITTEMLITILEAVMIEGFTPPLNDKGGDLLGTIYRQVEAPELTVQRRNERIDEFRQMLSEAMGR